jgi:hypothetical protein
VLFTGFGYEICGRCPYFLKILDGTLRAAGTGDMIVWRLFKFTVYVTNNLDFGGMI